MRSCLAWGLLIVAACGEVQPLSDRPQTLTVSVMGNGAVASTPAGIDCGATCTAAFDAGSSVMLNATPAADSALVGWSGDCSGLGPCGLTMDGPKTAMASFAVHGSKRWVYPVSFSGQDTIEKVVVDADGNVIAAGSVNDGNNPDLFVVKLAKEDGHVLWTQKIEVMFGADLGGLATDATGNVYLAARLQGDGNTPITIGTTTVVGDLFGNIIALRLAAATGAVVWVKQWGGGAQDIPEALAVSGDDLYVVGTTSSNPSTFDSKSIASSTGQGFVVRAGTASGTVAELKHIPASIDPFGVAVNGTHVAVVGRVRSMVSLDSRCNLQPSGTGNDAFLIDLLGTTLACQWGRNFGDFTNDNDSTFQSVAAFPGGGWVVVGDFEGSILLAGSGSSLTSRGSFDVVAGRFAADGGHVWSFRYGDTGFDLGYGVATTPEGSVVLGGTFNGSITFGLVTLTGVMNSFVTRMSPGTTPNHEWAVGLGGDSYDLTEGIATAPDGSVYIASIFNGMTNIAGTLLTAQDQDSWIAALVR